MALQLIAGASGSGKTYYANHMIMEEAVKCPDTNYYVIVPEQLNLSMQQDFLKISPTNTLFNVDVVSFGRLAERIIGRCGMVVPDLIDDTGKCLLLRKVAGDVQEELTVFKRQIKKPGFVQLMKSILSELLQYDITDQKLEELSQAANMPLGLKGKLRDMFLIYRAFNSALDNGIPKESLLSFVNRILPEVEHIKDSVFLFDGFTGFTPLQEKFIESLMSLGKMVYVTVTTERSAINEKKMDSFELFYMSHITINGLYRCAERAKAKVLSPVVLDKNERTKREDLLFLEKQIFRKDARYYDSTPENIRLTEMENPLSEIRCVAEQIYNCVSKKGYRYRDIAVIMGNMESYAPHVTRVFSQAGFSYYMDNKKNINSMPIVSYILYALEAVRWNADYENMFNFLKTGIVLDPEECSILENYVLSKGIRGFSAWKKQWKKEMQNMSGYTLAQINEIREKAIKNLLPLKEVLENDSCTAIEMLSAIVIMMQEDDVYGHVERQKEWYAEAGNAVYENLYDQIYEKIMDVFDQFAQTLGDKHIPVSECHDILSAGFSEIKAGIIPATADCIIVGDLQRTRVENAKVLFFVGLNDGNVPAIDNKVDMLNKRDREILVEDYSVELAPTVDTKQSFQRYYFYLTITKPSEYLYLSYAEMDNQGGSISPSSYLRELHQLYPAMEEQYAMPGEYFINDDTLLDMFANEVRIVPEKGISHKLRLIAGDLWSREENRNIMSHMISQAFFSYKAQNIGLERAETLYGKVIHASATRLETEGACPYAHFMKYGLGLSERDIYEVSQRDMGSVYHMVLEQFFKTAKENSVNWLELTTEERNDYICCCMESIAENYKDKLFKSTAKNRYFTNRISTVVGNAVKVLAKQVENAGYTVKDVEISFTAQESAELNIPLDNGGNMQLSGRVDRLDIKESESIMYAKVIDYKTGSVSFDATLAYNGLQLQSIYMNGAEGIVKREYPEKEVHTGGFAYFHIKDQYIETDGTESTEQIEEKIMKEMEMTGIVNLAAEPNAKKNGVEESTLKSIKAKVEKEAKKLGNKIANGDVEIAPYKRKDNTACDYCPYKAICGFDCNLPGYEYRRLKEVSKEDFSDND
jgi:ATP-dependent helicase/nuclease subunit B